VPKGPSENSAAHDAESDFDECDEAVDGWQHPAETQARRRAQAARPISRADARELWLLLILVFGGLASDARGASYAWVDVLSSTTRLVLVLLLIPGAWLVASWVRRKAVVVGVGLQGAAALGYAIIADVRWMLLPQIMLGVGLSIIGSLLIYLISAAFLTLHLRGLGLASLTIGMFIGLRSLSGVALRATASRLATCIRPIYLMGLSVAGVALASHYDPATVTVLSDMLRSGERNVGVAVWVTSNSLPRAGSPPRAWAASAVPPGSLRSSRSRHASASSRWSCCCSGGAGRREGPTPWTDLVEMYW
jgi:hypothetical protein